MNHGSTISSFLASAFLIVNSAVSQDSVIIYVYPSSSTFDEKVNARVSIVDQKYKYGYEIVSYASSEQDIWSFGVYTTATIDTAEAPSSWAVMPPQITPDIPGIPWWGDDSVAFIRPNSSLVGFSCLSAGIPSIKDYYTNGWVELPVANADPDSFVGAEEWRIGKVGKTLAPANPPYPFLPVNFLDTIKSYVNESRTLNWIFTQATANKYTALINSAQSHLAATPPERGIAKAKLDSVLLSVYPDSAAGLLTSEAYALLRFNTEYVLQKLREEDSDHQEEGKTKPR